ncbi:hypothetical protein GAY28_33165, partial [Azospirillum brasilense]|nr:hypothetical protein [Azospirillum brasilense]
SPLAKRQPEPPPRPSPRRGESSACVGFTRLFPVFDNHPEALRCARAIAGCQPRPAAAPPPKVTQLRRRKPAESLP